MTSPAVSPAGYWAARLAVLYMRSSLPERARLNTDAYTLAPSAVLLTADAVARRLAVLPKPLNCVAEARDRAVFITTSPVPEPSSTPASHWSEGFADMVRKRYGEGTDDMSVIWVGRGEHLRISLREVREFSRNYRCSPHGGGAGGPIESEWAKSQGITPADSQGAVAVYKVFPAGSGWGFSFKLPRWLSRLVVRRLKKYWGRSSSPQDS